MDIIYGRNSVSEALASGRNIDKILIKESPDGALLKIKSKAKEAGIPVNFAERKRLDALCEGGVHQGVLAYIASYKYSEVEDILNAAKEKNEPPFIIICDKIQDPHNLGAIIRTAGAAGAHGVIVSKHEGAGLSGTVAKSAAGALEFVPVARVANIAKTIDMLKEEGLWVTGTAMNGEKTLFEADLSGAVALVMGSEGEGMSRLVREKCDFLVNIPMSEKSESLNVSCAAALLMYEVYRRRINL